LFFGLIHGLGFSNYLSMLLSEENSLILPLFGFNTGVEAGQILIVASLLLLSFLVLRITSIKLRDWIFLLSGAGIGTSIIMIIDRI
ncbi:MAG TPA: HupE/UreJ family protein, partial [Salinivirga sp.]|uniref:HupE/UreJ family protein n=1 Tax=Salinivirga sp. TaxID=1970192 RepID=UPI002B45DB73